MSVRISHYKIIVFIAFYFLSAGCASIGCPPCERISGPSGGNSLREERSEAQGVVYVSDKGEILKAFFDKSDRSVLVKRPGGKTIKLPLAVSASGARYSNGRETFWEHHGEGSYWIGEKLVFRGMVTAEHMIKEEGG